MKLNEPNLLIEAAESGNFAAFCIFSLLEGINLEKISDFEDFYEEIRKKLPNCKETQDSSWFSLKEFLDFCENSENILLEVASAQSRMKMKRAAKRTSRVRARKRAIREKLRKNKTQLSKRAYNQVKTEMRNRLSGGKPWSSLSLSTRIRIDTMISRRKPVLKRMVKQRIQKMPSQESQRLRKLSMREEYTQKNMNLQEINNEQREREQGRKRKRNFDRRNNEDPVRFIMRSRLATRGGKKRIINQDSLTPNHTDVANLSLKEYYSRQRIEENNSVSPQQACMKAQGQDGASTPTSEKLCGSSPPDEKPANPSGQTTEKPKGGNNMESQPSSSLSSRASRGVGSWVAEEGAGAFVEIRALLGGTGVWDENWDKEFLMAISENEGKNKVMETLFSEDPNQGLSPQSRKLLQFVLRGSPDKQLEMIGTIRNMHNQISKNYYNSEPILIYNIGNMGTLTTGEGGKKRVAGVSVSDTIVLKEKLLIDLYRENKKGSQPTPEELYRFGKQQVDEFVSWDDEDPKNGPHRLSTEERYSIKYGQTRLIDKMIGGERWGALMNAVINRLKEKDPNSPIIDKVSKAIQKIADLIAGSLGSGDKKELIPAQAMVGLGGGSNQEISEKLTELQKNIQKVQDELMDDPAVRTELIFEHFSAESYFSESSIGRPTGGILIIDSSGGVTRIDYDKIYEYARELASQTTLKARFKSTRVNSSSNNENKRRILSFMNEAMELAKKSEAKAKGKESEFNETKFRRNFNKQLSKALQLNEKFLTENDIGVNQNITPEVIQGLDFSKWQATEDPSIEELRKQLLKVGIRPLLRTKWLVLRAEQTRGARKPTSDAPMEKNPARPTTESFSFSPLLRLLLEKNRTTNNSYLITPEEEAIIDEFNNEYLQDFKPTEIYNTLDSMMQFSGLEFEDIYYDPPIDFSDFASKPKTSSINSVYVNGTLHMIPVDEDPENMQENIRIAFASRFLNENKKRNYRSEYDNYQGKPQQIKNRSKRNMARRWAERKGLVKKGDGKDIDHKNGNPKDNSPSNLRVRSRSANRADNN